MAAKNVIGLTEDVLIKSKGHAWRIKARIDTGAQSNSIDTKLAESLGLGPVIRTAIVRSANGRSVRPVINITIELAGEKIESRFTLADRSRMKYKILIGRNILTKCGFFIDPSRDLR